MPMLGAAAFLVVAAAAAMAVEWFLRHGNDACDEPLKYYINSPSCVIEDEADRIDMILSC